jgi:hypothetical protein
MRRILLSLPFLLLLLAPAAEAQTVSVPNTLTNGSVAEADAMNANFTELEVGINAALTTGSVSVPNTFTNGTTADADEVNENFTELETGVNTALTNRTTDCAGAGGTWIAEISRCVPAPPVSNYNCFIGGFCSQAAISWPPTTYGYSNLYHGETQSAGAPLAAGCNTPPGSESWLHGVSALPGSFCPDFSFTCFGFLCTNY